MAFTTTTELLTSLKTEVGNSAPSSTESTRLLNLLDQAHKEIVGGGGILNVDKRNQVQSVPYLFSWAREATPIILTTELPVSTGTVAITKGSAALTFSSGPASSLTGWYIRIGNKDNVYKISSHTAASTSATLDSVFVDTTVTAATFEAFKLDYSLGSASQKILIPADYARGYNSYPRIPLINQAEFTNRYPLSEVASGDIRAIGVINLSTDGVLTVRLSHYPDDYERIDLSFVKVPSDLTTSSVDPILPKIDRRVLVHLAAYYDLSYRNDTRANFHLITAINMFRAMRAKDEAFTTQNDMYAGGLAAFPGGFQPNYRKRFSSGDYDI